MNITFYKGKNDNDGSTIHNQSSVPKAGDKVTIELSPVDYIIGGTVEEVDWYYTKNGGLSVHVYLQDNAT